MKERFTHNWTDYARSIGYRDEREMLEDMYLKQGLSLAQVADRLQCGTHTVNRHLDLLNINRRSRGGCNSSSSQTRKLFYLDQRVVHHQLINRLAKEINVSGSLIYKYKRMISRLPEDDSWTSVSYPLSQGSTDIAF